MGESTSFSFDANCNKISKTFLGEIFDFLFDNNCDYNVSFLCQYQGQSDSELFLEKSLSKNSHEKIDERIDFLISQEGGAIEFGWRNNKKIFPLLFHVHPTKSKKGFVHLALSFRSSVKYDDIDELNDNYELILTLVKELSKFVNEEMKIETTEIKISKL